jgi:hypothetical protein
MPQQKTQFITHTFAGGWATDFGPTFYGAPDQGLQFKIPYLTNAKNLVYEFDGGPRTKCPYRSGLRGGYTSGSSFDQGRS